MRHIGLAIALWFGSCSGLLAYEHGPGHHHHHHGGRPGWGWGGTGWGGTRIGFGGPFLSSFSSFNYGYSSFGLGGLNYYYGPVGGPVMYGYGPYYGPYGYGGYGYPGLGPVYGYAPVLPVQYWGPPPVNLANNAAIQEWMPNRQVERGPAAMDEEDLHVLVKPSTNEGKRKSIRYQAQGDEYFVKANYIQAYARYKQASSAAADRPEPRFRMAVSLAAMGRFGPAADEIKRLVRLDPEWPVHGNRLDELFGEGRGLSKEAVLQRVANWVREDVRDPERLYLMGVLLHFNEDRDKAKTFFETASLLEGEPGYVTAFLNSRREPRPIRPRPAPPPDPREEDDDAPPVPKPMAKPPRAEPAPALAGPRLLFPGETEPDER